MSHSTLTPYDRGAIETLIGLGYSLQKIADTLGFAKSTIHYELQRVKPYSAQLAQQDANQKRHLYDRRVTLKPDWKRQIENHLRLTWSPEAVGHYLHVATVTLYDWLHKGRLDFALTDLPHRNVYQRRKQDTRGTFQIDQSIEQRPTDINNRTSFGHWEVDTVLSSRGQDKTCLVTFVERQSRFLWAIKALNRTKEAMAHAFQRFIRSFGNTV